MNKFTMKDIAIYGFGGFGREVACVIKAINQKSPKWNLIGYFDDTHQPGESNSYGIVLGGLDTLNNYNKPLSIVVAIATPIIVQSIISKINNKKITYPNIIAPNVLFFDEGSFQIGIGNIITFGSRISCNVSIGNFNLLNGCVSLGHDVVLGDYNMLQPETRISGNTIIGNLNFFGVRSLVLQGLKIGNQVKVGTSSVIMRKTKDGKTYFGCPAKIINV